MKDMLQFIGISPKRLRLEWIATSEGNKLARVVGEFTEEISELGPSPLRKVRVTRREREAEALKLQA